MENELPSTNLPFSFNCGGQILDNKGNIVGKGLITIIKESCSGCPMIWDVILPDGSEGYIRYRWGIISLNKVTEKAGIFQEPIISEQIGDKLDGVLYLEVAMEWLKNKGYSSLINLMPEN